MRTATTRPRPRPGGRIPSPGVPEAGSWGRSWDAPRAARPLAVGIAGTGRDACARCSVALVLLLCLAFITGCGERPSGSVTLYCSQDQPFAEGLLADFTRDTGIEVRVLYDSEATKTVGLANRLIAEKAHPRADLFWANEAMRVRQLEAAGVFGTNQMAPGQPAWEAFGRRTRRLVVASSSPPGGRPRSLVELTNARWHGRVALALPLFGTTSTHFHALRARWGRERFEAWCRALAAGRPFLEDGNAAVVRRVARGEAWVGLTDSDDIRLARAEGLDVEALGVESDMIAIPNVVALVAPAAEGAPARRLAVHLASAGVRARLVASGALDAEAATGWGGFEPDWGAVLRDLVPATRWMEEVFRR